MKSRQRLALLTVFSSLLPIVAIVHAQLLPIVNEPNADSNELQTYIVNVDKPLGADSFGAHELRSYHESFLPTPTLDSGAPRLIYSYRDVMSGFAARLTPAEVAAMESKPGFVHARVDQVHPLLTTYTPQFMGLTQQNSAAWASAGFGQGVVIGILDTGIHPTHPSFDPAGMPPPPPIWRGNCSLASGVWCNNKIIAARGFNASVDATALDTDGHGTHVASTAAGNSLDNANVLGRAFGTAVGMAPLAHLAIYKVCFEDGCAASDTLAAIDQAIYDGVDIISMSIGGNATYRYYYDGVAQGSLAAVSHGIIAVAAAGNEGPAENTLAHDAPWVLTVGASSTDRRCKAIVKLGNGEELEGETAYQPSSFNQSRMLPIVYPGAIVWKNASVCLKGSLDHIDVRQKIVLCHLGGNTNVEKGEVVYAAGGAAMVLLNPPSRGFTTPADPHVLPAVHLSHFGRVQLLNYYYSLLNSSGVSAAHASIVFHRTTYGNRPSPAVVAFSSRGPPPSNGGILKPDVLAPGSNILAAWPFAVGPNPSGLTVWTFNFESGTSMATPHVAGIAALIKRKHPTWPPAYANSAIITSAKDVDIDGNPIADELSNGKASIFATGAGHVDPVRAMDPGLVYDIRPDDYVGYLCGLGYADWELQMLYNRPVTCSAVSWIQASAMNYPSIQVSLPSMVGSTVTVSRTVTNVGDPRSVYTARITAPQLMRVDLSTYRLRFSRLYEEASFDVALTVIRPPSGFVPPKYAAGKIEWVSGNRVVKTPIAVKFA
ncbi:subtilisin-like protease SBT1.5 [Ananas comosus]|uniref:Subtilisin-like protease SBT1.5 n=1 Tax=Ananas comosus TaxID=4615 RepID=A0A6P5FUX1_ANACO|nr:subtilisin-like protease SBT1.5 [Ananas comosus]